MIQTYQLDGESQYYELSFEKNKTVNEGKNLKYPM